MNSENNLSASEMVKATVSMEMLIIWYGFFDLVRTGQEVRLKCPFHDGKSSRSLSINLDKNVYYCFGCKHGGGVIEFVVRYESCSFIEAVEKLFVQFDVEREFAQPAVFRESREVAFHTTANSLIAEIEFRLMLLKNFHNPS